MKSAVSVNAEAKYVEFPVESCSIVKFLISPVPPLSLIYLLSPLSIFIFKSPDIVPSQRKKLSSLEPFKLRVLFPPTIVPVSSTNNEPVV